MGNIISSKEALSDVIPIDWNNNESKIILSTEYDEELRKKIISSLGITQEDTCINKWTRKSLIEVMHRGFDLDGSDEMLIDVSHCSPENIEQVIEWVQEIGYKAESIEDKRVRIWR